MRFAFQVHLDRLMKWMPQQRHMTVLLVNYNRLILHPELESQTISDFLAGKPSIEAMLSAIDPSLYRNRQPQSNSNNSVMRGSPDPA
jgi:hypothetical protein